MPDESEQTRLDDLAVAVLELNGDGAATYVNRQWEELTGLTEEQSRGEGWAQVLRPGDRATVLAQLAASAVHECGVETPRGRRWTRWLWRDSAGATRLVTVLDLSDERLRQIELADLASKDPLTGVLNRRAFLERLSSELATSQSEVGVVYADLNGFKEVNDTGGHARGDTVLRLVAQRLRLHLRSGDVLGRVGGDEFAVFCSGTAAEVGAVAGRVESALDDPLSVDGEPLQLGASVGLVLARRGEHPEAVLARADRSMYEAKRDLDSGRVVRLADAGPRLARQRAESIAQHVYAAGLALTAQVPSGRPAPEPIASATRQLDAALDELRGAVPQRRSPSRTPKPRKAPFLPRAT